MKIIFKNLLKVYLKYITKIVLLINKPIVIAIAGSTNKTFVKNEIKQVFANKNLSFRACSKSFNTEIGLPLAILNLPSGYNVYKKWLPIMKQAPFKIFEKNFPKYLILEFGISNEKDMKYLLSITKPDISIITDISQRYLEGFENTDSMVNEYRLLTTSTKNDGLVILNADNKKIIDLKTDLEIKNVSFGIDSSADIKAVEIKRGDAGEIFSVQPGGQSFSINTFGKHHIYAKLISLAVEKYIND